MPAQYTLVFQQSPNYWQGRSSAITAIAIHWWGDPATNPTQSGVVNTLMNPARQASAHYVATGTNRKVVQLVKESDTSWATNSANPFTISIECDPRCRPEDYDVVAELIKDIRSRHGDLPLVPHNKYSATQCPGNWDLNRLNKLAITKEGSMKPVKTTFRIPWSEVLGRDAAKTHKGEFDSGIALNVGNQDWPTWVQGLFVSKEAENYRRAKATAFAYYALKPKNDQTIKDLRAELAATKKQLETCKATSGDSTKWETLKALIRELIGK